MAVVCDGHRGGYRGDLCSVEIQPQRVRRIIETDSDVVPCTDRWRPVECYVLTGGARVADVATQCAAFVPDYVGVPEGAADCLAHDQKSRTRDGTEVHPGLERDIRRPQCRGVWDLHVVIDAIEAERRADLS